MPRRASVNLFGFLSEDRYKVGKTFFLNSEEESSESSATENDSSAKGYKNDCHRADFSVFFLGISAKGAGTFFLVAVLFPIGKAMLLFRRSCLFAKVAGVL